MRRLAPSLSLFEQDELRRVRSNYAQLRYRKEQESDTYRRDVLDFQAALETHQGLGPWEARARAYEAIALLAANRT